MSELTSERLKELLAYNPETGVFVWKSHVPGKWNQYHRKLAGSINSLGRLKIRVDGTSYHAHRLAWLYVYGHFPCKGIDHINGDPLDNRISNLREADDSLNQMNRKTSSNTVSGRVGISWRPENSRWRAYLKVRGKHISLGSFDDFEDALEARLGAEKEYGFRGARELEYADAEREERDDD